MNTRLVYNSAMYNGYVNRNAEQGMSYSQQMRNSEPGSWVPLPSKAEQARELIARAMQLSKEAILEERAEAALIAEYGPRIRPKE